MGMATMLVMWPGQFEQILVPSAPDALYKIWLQAAHFQNMRDMPQMPENDRYLLCPQILMY